MSVEKHPLKATKDSRRDFLKKSLVGAAVMGGLSLARSVHAAGEGTIKVGIIGCGGRGNGAVGNVLRAGREVKLTAMCDIFANRLQNSRKTLKRMFPEQLQVDDDHCFPGFDGYQKVIDNVDVVLIACASKFHPMYAEAAIKAGKHVFVEKPHAIDPAGVQRMQAVCELAKTKNLSLVSGLHCRFHTGYQETIKRLHDGAIGDIVSLQCTYLRAPYRMVNRDPQYSETQYQFSNWYHFRWLSGDDVPQSLVHNIDRASWVLKEEKPQWAFGLGGRSASFGEVFGDMFDHHTVFYEYPSGIRLITSCRTATGCYDNDGDLIFGTKGKCDLGNFRIEGENKWQYKGRKMNPYDAEQKALIDSVRNGQPISSAYHMLNSTMIAILGQIACYTGAETTWEQVAKSNLRYMPEPESSNFETAPPTLPDKTGNYPLPMPGITKVDSLFKA